MVVSQASNTIVALIESLYHLGVLKYPGLSSKRIVKNNLLVQYLST